MRACCRAGAAPGRSRPPCWPGTPRPASPSCRWRPGSTPGRCCCARPCRSGRRRPRPTLHDELAELGARLILRALAEDPAPVPQPRGGRDLRAEADAAPTGGSTGPGPPPSWTGGCAAWCPGPAPGPSCGGETLKVLRPGRSRATGAPGVALDDRLLIACGEGALRLLRVQRPGRGPMDAERAAARHAGPGRHACWGDDAGRSCSNMTAPAIVGWQRQENGVSLQGLLEDGRLALGRRRAGAERGRRPDRCRRARGRTGGHDRAAGRDTRRPGARRAQLPPEAASVRRAAGGARRRRAGTRASPPSAALRVRDPEPPRPARRWIAASGTCRTRSTRLRCRRRPRLLLGRHDFTSFRAAACQAKSPLRTLDRLDVRRDGDRVLIAGGGPQLPAPSGPQHGRHAEAGRRGQLGAGAGRRRAGRPRPPRRRADRAARTG